jgi:hypothetical protein
MQSIACRDEDGEVIRLAADGPGGKGAAEGNYALD